MSSQRTNASAIISNKTIDKDGDDGGTGLGAGYIVLIVVGVLVLLVLLGVGVFFAVRRIRERRRNHGEYRPQLEEHLARDLPPIQPPNIEGLI